MVTGNKAKSRDLPGIRIPNISLELSAPRNEAPSPGTEPYLQYNLVIRIFSIRIFGL
jgi:hypothetical protein